jgi:ParB-like nuclease domain
VRLRLLVAVLVAFFVGAAPGTTTATALCFSYDVPAIARVDVQSLGYAEASAAQLSHLREALASSSDEARGVSTTLIHSFVATEAAKVGEDIVGAGHNAVRPTQDWIYPGTVDDYAARLRAGESVSPIEVQRLADGSEYILDGHHRYVASQLTGVPVPKVVARDVWDVGFPDWSDVSYVRQGPR